MASNPWPGSNGLVFAWGATNAPLPGSLSNVTAIAAGDNFCLALLSNGTVTAWGSNELSQTSGAGSLTGVVAIAAGGEHGLALKSDGTVTNWGDTQGGLLNVPTGLTNVMGIAAGYYHSLALSNNGTVLAWGDNTNGQASVPTGLAGVKSIAAGAYASFALEFSPLIQYYPLTAANDLLLIYNTNSMDSGTVLNYYLANRPMAANANVLGIGYTNNGYLTPSNTIYYETISSPDLTNHIFGSVCNWLNTNPTKRPGYVVLFLDVPSRVNPLTTFPVSPTNGLYPLYPSLASTNYSVSVQIQSMTNGWLPFVTHINMNGTNDCIAYINKLVHFATNYSPGKLVISAGTYGNANYVLDNVRHGTGYGPPDEWDGDYSLDGSLISKATNGLLQNGISSSSIQYLDGLERITNNGGVTNYVYLTHITSAGNVAGYMSWGQHSSLGYLYPLPGPVVPDSQIPVDWTNNSSWYIMGTMESGNGQRYFQYQGHVYGMVREHCLWWHKLYKHIFGRCGDSHG